MGITRSAEPLQRALIQIEQWQQDVEYFRVRQVIAERLTVIDALLCFQIKRQLQLATLIIHSAYQRYESRGGHYRQDYPHLADRPLTSIIMPLRSNSMDSINPTTNDEKHADPVMAAI